jgi:hypothetical protein
MFQKNCNELYSMEENSLDTHGELFYHRHNKELTEIFIMYWDHIYLI